MNAVSIPVMTRGPVGPRGPIPDHAWTDSYFLAFQKPDGSMGVPANLLGPQGPGGDALRFASRAMAQATSISGGIDWIELAGYATAGDGGRALYKRVVSQPAHSGKLQSFDGAWWELADPVIRVEMFGADGTALHDRDAIQTADDYCAAVGCGALHFLPRTYLAKRPGFTKNSGVHWYGVVGKTKIKAAETIGVGNTSDFIFASVKTDFGFHGIWFDADAKLGGACVATPGVPPGFASTGLSRYPTILPLLHLSQVENVEIDECKFTGWDTAAILLNIFDQVWITRCEVDRGSAEPSYPSMAIQYNGASALLPGRRLHAYFNILKFSSFAGQCLESDISHNDISGWAVGPGINFGGLSWVKDNRAVGNYIHDSNQAADLFNYEPGGFETFSAGAVLACNVIRRCFGAGIYCGGPSNVHGNDIADCGGGSGGIGIYMLRQPLADGGSRGADGSAVDTNRCYDTRVGGAKLQNYGYLEQSGAALQNVRLGDANNFAGNRFFEALFDGEGTGSTDWARRLWRSFTSTLSAASGAFTDATITLRWHRVGTECMFTATISVGASGAGNATGAVAFTLPFVNVNLDCAAAGFNTGAGALSCRVVGGDNKVLVLSSTGTFAGTNGARLVVSGKYQIAAD